jgi:hypothetical protein
MLRCRRRHDKRNFSHNYDRTSEESCGLWNGKYRSGEHIKFAPLYVDFLMETAAANAI